MKRPLLFLLPLALVAAACEKSVPEGSTMDPAIAKSPEDFTKEAKRSPEGETIKDVSEKVLQVGGDTTIDNAVSPKSRENELANGHNAPQHAIKDQQEEHVIRIARQEIEGKVKWAGSAEYRAVRHRQGGWRVTATEVIRYDANDTAVYGGGHYFIYIDDVGNVTRTSKGR